MDQNVPAKSVEERLKEEALSLGHLASHFPRNPFCNVCNRSTVHKKQARKTKEGEEITAERFAELILGDHLILGKKEEIGLSGEVGGVA